MSPSGRSAIPTDRPSSIQKPTSSSRVRSSDGDGEQHADPQRHGDARAADRPCPQLPRRPGGVGGHAHEVRRSRRVQLRPDEPAPVLVDLREARVVAERGEVSRPATVPGGDDESRPASECTCIAHATAWTSNSRAYAEAAAQERLGAAGLRHDRRQAVVELRLRPHHVEVEAELVHVERRRTAPRRRAGPAARAPPSPGDARSALPACRTRSTQPAPASTHTSAAGSAT